MIDSISNFIFNHTPLFYLTQSFWRDEAFSYFMAEPSVGDIITNSARDFNPPLYYILLHLWIQIVGKSDLGLRMISFLFFITAVYIMYLLGVTLFKRRYAFFAATMIFLNPLLLYYAFEARMYGLYILCAVASLYFLVTQRWKLYTTATVIGLYTHSFFILLPASLLAYSVFRYRDKQYFFRLSQPFIFYLPWIPVLALQFANSYESWLFPVDWKTILSVLGNMFIGYEGTPDGLWFATAFFSLVIGLFLVQALRYKKTDTGIFLAAIIVPITLIFGYSLLHRPLFVNRYMIFITVLEIIGICSAIASFRSSHLRRVTATLWIVFCLSMNSVAVQFHRKADFKSVFAEINAIAQPQDVVYTKTPIGYLESAYYYRAPDRVFVYNPAATAIPPYIGVTVLFADVSRTQFPPAPSTIFVVADDASYEIVVQR